MRLFSLREEFPTQWARFLDPTNVDDGNVFELPMSSGLFRFRDGQTTLKITSIRALARCTNNTGYALVINPGLAAPLHDPVAMARLDQYGGLEYGGVDVQALPVLVDPTEDPATWSIKMTGPEGDLQENPKGGKEVEDLFLVVAYQQQQD